METTAKSEKRSSRRWGCIVVLAILVCLLGIILGPITPSRGRFPESNAMQTCRAIALAEFQYANDHAGRYPTGRSSTEVFQQLVDGNYVSDSRMFFFAMPGKTAAVANHLKPENVCYDTTADIDSTAPDGLPVVFTTGYRIEYQPGGRAFSLTTGFPPPFGRDGLAIAYKSTNAFFRVSRSPSGEFPYLGQDGFGIVPDIISGDLDARGKRFRQLTPNGSL